MLIFRIFGVLRFGRLWNWLRAHVWPFRTSVPEARAQDPVAAWLEHVGDTGMVHGQAGVRTPGPDNAPPGPEPEAPVKEPPRLDMEERLAQLWPEVRQAREPVEPPFALSAGKNDGGSSPPGFPPDSRTDSETLPPVSIEGVKRVAASNLLKFDGRRQPARAAESNQPGLTNPPGAGRSWINAIWSRVARLRNSPSAPPSPQLAPVQPGAAPVYESHHTQTFVSPPEWPASMTGATRLSPVFPQPPRISVAPATWSDRLRKASIPPQFADSGGAARPATSAHWPTLPRSRSSSYESFTAEKGNHFSLSPMFAAARSADAPAAAGYVDPRKNPAVHDEPVYDDAPQPWPELKAPDLPALMPAESFRRRERTRWARIESQQLGVEWNESPF